MSRSPIYRMLYTRWPRSKAKGECGYTALLPVPADLPVFLDFAVENLLRQDLTHLREVLVIPDQEERDYIDLARQKIRRLEDKVRVRILSMRWRDKAVARFAGNPSAYHFLQLYTGICAAEAGDMLFHDADFFMRPGDFLSRRYELMKTEGRSVLGVNPRQAKFVDGCVHLTATWEMFAAGDWLRRFPPYFHKAQYFRTRSGKSHFDTTLYPQYLSSPDEIGWRTPEAGDYVHFNQVISRYRHFSEGNRESKRADLKLLLISILSDAFGTDGWRYKLPTRRDWQQLVEHMLAVPKLAREQTAYYAKIRGRVEELLALGVLDGAVQDGIREGFAPFDKLLGWANQKQSVVAVTPK